MARHLQPAYCSATLQLSQSDSMLQPYLAVALYCSSHSAGIYTVYRDSKRFFLIDINTSSNTHAHTHTHKGAEKGHWNLLRKKLRKALRKALSKVEGCDAVSLCMAHCSRTWLSRGVSMHAGHMDWSGFLKANSSRQSGVVICCNDISSGGVVFIHFAMTSWVWRDFNAEFVRGCVFKGHWSVPSLAARHSK